MTSYTETTELPANPLFFYFASFAPRNDGILFNHRKNNKKSPDPRVLHCHVFQKLKRTTVKIEVVWFPEYKPKPFFYFDDMAILLSTWVSIHISVTHELWNVLQDLVYLSKPCCIGCTWMASPQCASSCAAANYKIESKRSCTGCTCKAFLRCAFP